MGGSQSQEDRSQTFSTIGLPPASLYPRPERTQSLRVPGEVDPQNPSRSRVYRRVSGVEDSDDWIKVDRPPPRPPRSISHTPLPPVPITQTPLPPVPPLPSRDPRPRVPKPTQAPSRPRPPPPRAHSHSSVPNEARLSQRPAVPTSHSTRQFDEQEILDLEQLLSTLHHLQLSSRPNQTSDDSGSGMEPSERRRRHAHGSAGTSRTRTRLRHHRSHNGPLLFLRPVPMGKCPLCSKEFPQPELEEHLPACSQKPRIQFNEDTLIQDAGECSICLDDMVAGDEIARLPCLCVYHIVCITQWFKKSQTCPEHPDMKAV